MKIESPSHEFDEAVAAVCHGTASDEQAQALNELLRGNTAARDEYILQIELHSRLASEPDLFFPAHHDVDESGLTKPEFSFPQNVLPLPVVGRAGDRGRNWAITLAACVALLATGWWGLESWRQNQRQGATSKAVAMLHRVVDAQWDAPEVGPRPGAPLEPGVLRLKSGLAQIVFYSGVRAVIEGPTELKLISPGEVSCLGGRLIAEVPPQAKGFRVSTPQMNVTDLGTAFGVAVKERLTELHVFEGAVEFLTAGSSAKQHLRENAGAIVENSQGPRLIVASPAGFASLFDLQAKSVAAESLRREHWREASRRLNQDPSLLVRFDFEHVAPSDWRLRNTSSRSGAVPDATIVGGQWIEGRWPGKAALEFQGMSDRVRLSVPGEFESLTIAAWVRVQGLDRQINSLFMSDGFEAGTVHWSIREDGVLGLTVIGPGDANFQIVASPPVVTLEEFGIWLHLAAVVDGGEKRVVHYVNGRPVGEKALRIDSPFRVGTAELGNWNARGFPGHDPFHIRNFSGAMDEFCLFSRALTQAELRALYAEGQPQPDPVSPRGRP